MEQNNLSQWVMEQTAQLDPPAEWQPDPGAALTRLHARIDAPAPQKSRVWMRWVLAGLLAAGAVVAQQVWQHLTVQQIGIVRLDLHDIPKGSSLEAKMLLSPGHSVKVRDAAEAQARAGFEPRLPQPGILAGTPHLSVLAPMAFGTVLKLADLQALLDREHIADQPLPSTWDGARIVLDIHPLVTAEWNDISLMQSTRPNIAVPNGFDFAQFLTAVMRGLGVPKEQAAHIASMGPMVLFPIQLDESVSIKEVQLKHGPATMVYDLDDSNKIERLTLSWSTKDRVYILSGVLSDSVAIAAANSIE